MSNITNPKVLVFHLAVPPQLLGAHASVVLLAACALSHALLPLAHLLGLVAALHRVRVVLSRRGVRRVLDAMTGEAAGVRRPPRGGARRSHARYRSQVVSGPWPGIGARGPNSSWQISR